MRFTALGGVNNVRFWILPLGMGQGCLEHILRKMYVSMSV